MEQHDAGLVQSDEGASTAEETAVETETRTETKLHFGSGLHETLPESTVSHSPRYEVDQPFGETLPFAPVVGAQVQESSAPELAITPTGVEGIPPELIGPDGKPLPLTESLMRKLRGKYFTVRHVPLSCGHKMDMINQPKTNCEICWWNFFNHHAELVKVTHEFYMERGVSPLIGMRGKKYVRFYLRFMSTVNHMMEEQKAQEKLNGSANQGGLDGTGETARLGDGTICEEAENREVAGVVEGREDQGDKIADAVHEQ